MKIYSTEAVDELKIKKYFNNLKESALWNFIKDETYKGQTIEKLISSAIEPGNELSFLVNTQDHISWYIHHRSLKYALLTAIYGYEALRCGMAHANVVNIITKALGRLERKRANLKYGWHRVFRSDIDELLKYNKDEKMEDKIGNIIKDYLVCIVGHLDLESSSLETGRIKLSRNVMDNLYKSFPKPHVGDEPYNFHTIPEDCQEIKSRLEKISYMLEVEYK